MNLGKLATGPHGIQPQLRAPTSLDDLLHPFEFLDLSRTYDHYSAIIDLFIFFLIFLGAAKVTLGRRFTGRAGTALCVGVALALSVGLVIAEERVGFNLNSFGPVAASLLILIFGLLFFLLLHHVGMSKLRSFCLAYITLYFVLHAVSPELFDWISTEVPLMGVLLGVVLFLTILIAITALWHGIGNQDSFQSDLRRIMASDPVRQQKRETVGKESRFIKKRLFPKSKSIYQDSEYLLDDLESISKTIQGKGNSPKSQKTILNQMQRLVPRGRELLQKVQDLRQMNERLLRLDSSMLSENSREQVEQMNSKDRDRFREEIQDEIEEDSI